MTIPARGPEFFDFLAFVDRGIGHAHLAKCHITHLVMYGRDDSMDIEPATRFLAEAIADLQFVHDVLKGDAPRKST